MGYNNKKTKQRIQFRGLAPYVRAWPLTFPQVSGVERTIVRKSIFFKEPLLTPSGSGFSMPTFKGVKLQAVSKI